MTLSPFPQKYVNYFKSCFDDNNWFNVMEGGKRAGKNILHCAIFSLIVDQHPDKLHCIGGVTMSTARINIIDSNGFGIKYYFKNCREGKYQDRDCLYVIDNMGREKIILVTGGDKVSDHERIQGFSIGSVYVSEANLCHENYIRELFSRTLASSNRKILHDLNPLNSNHWYYKLLDELKPNLIHTTIKDNYSVSVEHIQKVASTYDKSSFWYKRDILGLRVGAEGIIYTAFREDNVIEQTEITQGDYYCAIDYGTVNAFVILLIKDNLNDKIEVVDEFYWSGADTNLYQKSEVEYVEDFKEFVKDKNIVSVTIDPSANSFANALKKEGFYVKDADNSVLSGINKVQNLFHQKKLKINSKCIKTIEELKGYVWDSRAMARGEEKPIKEKDHCLDALRYYIKTNVSDWR